MIEDSDSPLIRRKYHEVFGAVLSPCFDTFVRQGRHVDHGAALGYRRAGGQVLFLERYLDAPIEKVVSAELGRCVAREAIVEIGNFAADNAMAMIALWGAVANDLGEVSEVAVATLTAPLRGMFARIGLPIFQLAPAKVANAGDRAGHWGSYYDLDPWVCAGLIHEGQAALAAFLARRQTRAAA